MCPHGAHEPAAPMSRPRPSPAAPSRRNGWRTARLLPLYPRRVVSSTLVSACTAAVRVRNGRARRSWRASSRRASPPAGTTSQPPPSATSRNGWPITSHVGMPPCTARNRANRSSDGPALLILRTTPRHVEGLVLDRRPRRLSRRPRPKRLLTGNRGFPARRRSACSTGEPQASRWQRGALRVGARVKGPGSALEVARYRRRMAPPPPPPFKF